MTPKKKMPTDEEMRGWIIDVPDEGPGPKVSDKPLSPARAKALKARVEQARKDQKRDGAGIAPRMSQEQLRSAGVRIDLPTEAASAEPKDIRYADGTTLVERLRARKEARLAGKPKPKGEEPEKPEEGGGTST
jgi:hypothetical protein